MKAIVLIKYSSPDNLELKEIPKPVPKENEVLVKVYAAAVNDYEWSFVRGKPFLYRLMFGIMKPKRQIPGMEIAGKVEECGKNVDTLGDGDEVYGDISEYGFGGFAEYVCINENALSLKPKSMSFEEAASIPHASMLAVQGLIDRGKIQQGDKVLINGAGGGVGTFGLQIAKLFNAKVTGVDTGKKLKMMKSLGFDNIIDYKKNNFTKNGQKYDLILDAKTSLSTFSYLSSLKPKGTYVTVGGSLPRLLQALLLKPIISLFSKKKINIVALKPNKDLDYINKLYEEGKIKCVIDGPFTLENVPKAIQHFGNAKHSGKIIISIVNDKNHQLK